MTTATLTDDLAAAVRATFADHVPAFVRRFVCIEDPDTGMPAPFDLWPMQEQALRTFLTARLVVVLKARQLGLSWLALAYALTRMLTRPGYRVTVLSRGETEAKEMVRRVAYMLRHLPGWIVAPGAAAEDRPGWEATTLTVTVRHADGEPSVLTAMPAAEDSGRSFTASIVIIDEWAFQQHARRIWSAAYPTVNRPDGGQVIGISTGQIGTLFEEIWTDAVNGRNAFHPIFLPWHADPRRDAAWYEETKRALPNTYRAEYPSTPEEAFTMGEGAAFQEWNPAIHVPYGAEWYPPPTWRIVRAYDGGFVQPACKWYALGPDGQAVAYREYYPERVTDDEQAQEIRALSRDQHGAPEVIAYTVADPAVWAKHSGTGESTAEVFAKHGISLIRGDNDRINGWKRLHQWLNAFEGPDGKPTARLLHTRACVNSLRVYPSVPADKHRPDDVDTKAEDHLLDCDRYFVMSRPAPPVDEQERRQRIRRRYKATRPVVSSVTGY